MAGDTPSPEEKVQTTVYITREQKEWLAENDEINLSGFVRRKLDEMCAVGDETGEATVLADEIRRREGAVVVGIDVTDDDRDSRTSAGDGR